MQLIKQGQLKPSLNIANESMSLHLFENDSQLTLVDIGYHGKTICTLNSPSQIIMNSVMQLAIYCCLKMSHQHLKTSLKQTAISLFQNHFLRQDFQRLIDQGIKLSQSNKYILVKTAQTQCRPQSMEGGECAQMAKNYKRNFQYAHFRSFPQKVNDKFIQKHFKKLIAPISHIN